MQAYKKLILAKGADGRIWGFSPSYMTVWIPGEDGLPTLHVMPEALQDDALYGSQGIYAVSTSADPQLESYTGDLVLLWLHGYVLEHERGFRASDARVLRVLTGTGEPSRPDIATARGLLKLHADHPHYEGMHNALVHATKGSILQMVGCQEAAPNPMFSSDKATAEAAILAYVSSVGTATVSVSTLFTLRQAYASYWRHFGQSPGELLILIVSGYEALRSNVYAIQQLIEMGDDTDLNGQHAWYKPWLYRLIKRTQSAFLRVMWLSRFGFDQAFLNAVRRNPSPGAVLALAQCYGRMPWMEVQMAYATSQQKKAWSQIKRHCYDSRWL
jgi:hypothetical protein